MMEIYDVNNNKLLCELLFTFEKNNKQFIVYKDKDDDILSSYYKKDGDKLIIIPITDKTDYDIVDIELEKWWNKNDEQEIY